MAEFSVARGTTFTLTLNYQRNGSAASLVGCTVFLTVKSALYDGDVTDSAAVISKTKTTYVAAGDNAAGGVAVITLAPIDTQLITPANYYYDIKVKDAGGNIYEVDSGRMQIAGNPTNRES